MTSTATNKRVLITGASSGIGLVTAQHLSNRGFHVVATSRDRSRLTELLSETPTSGESKGGSIVGYELDVNDSASVSRVVPQILEENGPLDGLVNNAGYALWGYLEDLTVDDLQAQLETNLLGVFRMCRAVLPQMRKQGRGTIVNVGSIAGRMGSPGGGAYSTSKYALDGFSRVLRMEVEDFGIKVSLIEPGAFRTNFQQNIVIAQGGADPTSPYHDYSESFRTRISSSNGSWWAGDPLTVAKRIENILKSKSPKARYGVGLDARAGILATRRTGGICG